MTLAHEKHEKRRYPRLPVSVKVEGLWWDLEGEQHPLAALMVAVSQGGALLRCADPVPANCAVAFILRLGTLKRIEVRAVVRWWRRNGEVRDIGVEFVEPIERLGRYVEKQLALAAVDTEPEAPKP